jgi:hypothetical protein
MPPHQRWAGLTEPYFIGSKLTDLSPIFTVDGPAPAGYVDRYGRLAVQAGGRDSNGGG